MLSEHVQMLLSTGRVRCQHRMVCFQGLNQTKWQGHSSLNKCVNSGKPVRPVLPETQIRVDMITIVPMFTIVQSTTIVATAITNVATATTIVAIFSKKNFDLVNIGTWYKDVVTSSVLDLNNVFHKDCRYFALLNCYNIYLYLLQII